MAEYTYQTRRKMTENWIGQLKEKSGKLSAREKNMLPTTAYYSIPQKECDYISLLLNGGRYSRLSDIYKNEFPNITELCVREDQRAEFYYALDEMNQYQMTAGWLRRSVRSTSYAPFAAASIRLLRAYARLNFYGGNLAAVLTGQTDPEIYDHARTESWAYAGILAARVDLGDGETIQAIKDILYGESNTAMMSHELIRGIVMSKNQELYKDLGAFLLAARLQEGARQAVCETMDAGRPEAFLHLFRVIEDNNLVRFSSIKRAVSTWIGIFDENSVDRITDKLVRLMGQCLREPEFCEEQLKTNDSIAISCALWAKGFYDAEDAIKAEQELIRSGTKNQKMTASFFNNSLQFAELKMKAAKEMIFNFPDDIELAACFMPSFLSNVYSEFTSLVSDSRSYYSVRTEKVKKPAKKLATDLFDSEDEARRAYVILSGMLKKVPKKGVVLNPCIFPWYSVTMTQSDLVERMCLIAWMLQDEAYLDEVAPLIPLIGQGAGYGAATRAMAARIILYRPSSPVRKKVLFDLLHNTESYTLQTAHGLVNDMDLTSEDYKSIEQNLKYKTGRVGTLDILKKQKTKDLLGSIERLLNEKSEECHMGALDLALQVKKDAPEQFETLRPVLEAVSNPTGKEMVLIKELVGEKSEAQDILNKPGYGLYNLDEKWVLPPAEINEKEASSLFQYGEKECIRILYQLNGLIEKNKALEYKTAWDEEAILGTKLERCRWSNDEKSLTPLDLYPFKELWEKFYQDEIKTPEMLLELYLYQQCRKQRQFYEKNIEIYKKVFGSGLIKKPPFKELVQGLRYGEQARTVIDTLFAEYVPNSLKTRWALVGTAKLLAVLDDSNSLFEVSEKRWNGEVYKYTKRAAELPVFWEFRCWLNLVDEKDWGAAFTLRFNLTERYTKLKQKEKTQYSYQNEGYLQLSDFVRCYVTGLWNKSLFYKAVFHFLGLWSILGPVSTVEQKGAISSRDARPGELNSFFGMDVIKTEDGKYHFDNLRETLPAMKLAHELYEDVVPMILKVELKRGEQETPFSSNVSSIHVVYGIDTLIQILTALGKDTLQRGYSYYSSGSERKRVLSHLLEVCHPLPDETAADLKKALKGTDITKKRMVEAAMYARQWIPMVEEYLELPGFQSGCYYFMAHTSEGLDDFAKSMVAKYTPLSPEELRDGAFDVKWFFEAYEKLGEKNFKLLYDAAKYSSSGTAHGRARKYADAALGKVELEPLKEEIDAKRNKDLLMSIGLLPLSKGEKKREKELLERYQFIQKFKKESKQFGAQRRASEGRAVEIALRNLSVNAGFSDVTRLTLRMETKLVETLEDYFTWKPLDEIELCILVDETGKSSLQCRKGEKVLKSVPAKYKKNEVVLDYQQVHKKLKEQYSRTKQMMEQAMEDETAFEVWEFKALKENTVVRPIIDPLVLKLVRKGKDGEAAGPICLGFLTESGLTDWKGDTVPVTDQDEIVIAHPFDLYKEGHWHEYQKLLFEKQLKQPFKQVFRELYVKLAEEMEKDQSLMFSGNQIQPQKTVGALRSRRWVADYEDGLQKIYYKENIVARIYAMADWFSPSDVEAPTLEWVVFSDRKTFKPLKIKEIPDIIYSEVMRDVDLAVSVAHAGGVDPETSHSTVEMRRAIVECNLELFGIKNVRVEGTHAIIDGKLGQYTVHLGSGVVHQMGNSMLFVIPVHSQHRGRMFLPFIDDDPKTAEIMSKVLLFAEDTKIKDPNILSQIR